MDPAEEIGSKVNSNLIKRSACGRVHKIGDIYDFPNDQFIPMNMFTSNEARDCFVERHPSGNVHYESVLCESLKDILKLKNLSGDISLSFLAGLVPFEALAKLNSKLEEKEQAVCYNIEQKIGTVTDRISSITDDALLTNISLTALDRNISNATHVVVGIDYGTTATLSLKYQLSCQESCTEVQGKLKASFLNFQNTLSGEMGANGQWKNTLKEENMSISIQADLIPDNLDMPTKLEEAISYMKAITKCVGNDRIGVPLVYHLMDINFMRHHLKQPLAVNSIYSEISTKLTTQLEDVMSESLQQFARLKDFERKCKKYSEVIPTLAMEKIMEKKEHCDAEITKMEKTLREYLPLARTNNEEAITELKFVLAQFKKASLHSQKMTEFLNQCQSVQRGLEFAEELEQRSIPIIISDEKFYQLQRVPDRYMYTLMFNMESAQDPKDWCNIKSSFLELNLIKEPKDILVVMNSEKFKNIRETEGIADGNKIICSRNGVYITRDQLKDIESITATVNVAYSKNDFEVSTLSEKERTLDLVLAEFRCPNIYCNIGGAEKRFWVCCECIQELEYHTEKMKLYCGCGSLSPENFSFKCCSRNHGSEPILCNSTVLEDLNLLGTPKLYYNLIIGKSGTGKSTLINSIANYLCYSTLDEAADPNNKLHHLIPYKVARNRVEDADTTKSPIIISGTAEENENERFNNGCESSTQSPKAYYIRVRDQVHCFIDTPGIGDTRGIIQDKQNMDKIVNFIANLEYIHLICFLLPAFESRLDEHFIFCFKELLIQFHRSAANNIVFCFTKTGDFTRENLPTFQPLTALLDSIHQKHAFRIHLTAETMFLFDNSALRYLTQIKKREPPDLTKESCEKHYINARNQLNRLVEYSEKSSPHNVKETFKVNHVRKLANMLIGVLLPLSQGIQLLIKEAKDKSEAAEELKESSLENRNKMYYEVSKKRYVLVDCENSPVVLCANCATSNTLEERIKKLVKRKDKGLAKEKDLIGWKGGDIIVKEVIINGETIKQEHCPNCGPNFPRKESKKAIQEIDYIDTEIDETYKKKAERQQDDAFGLYDEVDKLKGNISHLKLHDYVVTQCLAVLSCYLKQNSTGLYNDAAAEYIQQCMEKEKQENGEKTERYKMLERMLHICYTEFSRLEDTADEEQPDYILNHILHVLLLKQSIEFCKEEGLISEDMKNTLETIFENNPSDLKGEKMFVVPCIPDKVRVLTMTIKSSVKIFSRNHGSFKPQN